MDNNVKLFFSSLKSIAFLLSFVFLLASCTEEDEDDMQIGDSGTLIGSWDSQSLTFTLSVDGQDYVDWLIENLALTQSEAEELRDLFNEAFEETMDIPLEGATLTFNDDGTLVATAEGQSDTGAWSLEDAILSITESGEITDFNVVELTESSLVLEATESIEEDLNFDDVTDTLVISIRLLFTR